MRSVAIAVAIADAALRAKGMPSSPSDVTQRLARSPSFFRMEASARQLKYADTSTWNGTIVNSLRLIESSSAMT